MGELILKSIFKELQIHPSCISGEGKMSEEEVGGALDSQELKKKKNPRKIFKFLNSFVPGWSFDLHWSESSSPPLLRQRGCSSPTQNPSTQLAYL